ncbi:EcsC family protein [Vibrio genomosp. F6]|uniref:EcsC family protein n=1 Tax=Vibrio genomosp. F6 TaxID=723172 RepID=UPI0010BCF7A9|nr:EcsC family protein [Vibrio genomosp. F6]TKF14181.1 EcsC family protein [Vibrio genomosp. F6]
MIIDTAIAEKLEFDLTPYEKKQIKLVRDWKLEEPSVISKGIGFVLSPLTWLVNQVVPTAAIKGILDFSSTAAEWLTDTNDILRDAKVTAITDLKYKDLELSDDLANEIHNWAIGIATAEGAGTGAAGVAGIAVDIPAIITLALRTIHKIGICYGFEVKTKEDREFVLAILSASGANDMSEKVAALTTLRTIEVNITKQTWKKMAQKAAEDKMCQEAAIMSIKTLAKQLGINLTKRKALQAIPAIGAVVGGSVNGWYIKEVGWAARRAFQERWLIENKKIIEIN